jgi:hypothetical protein
VRQCVCVGACVCVVWFECRSVACVRVPAQLAPHDDAIFAATAVRARDKKLILAAA